MSDALAALAPPRALPMSSSLTPPSAAAGAAEAPPVRAAGPRIAFDPDIGRALDGSLPEGEISSRTAPAAMLCLLAESLGGGLQYAKGDDALVMGAVLPIG